MLYVQPLENIFKNSKHSNLEKDLLTWLQKMGNLNIPVDANVLEEKQHFF